MHSMPVRARVLFAMVAAMSFVKVPVSCHIAFRCIVASEANIAAAWGRRSPRRRRQGPRNQGNRDQRPEIRDQGPVGGRTGAGFCASEGMVSRFFWAS